MVTRQEREAAGVDGEGRSPTRREPEPVDDLEITPLVGALKLSWSQVPMEPLLDHYAIYGTRVGKGSGGHELLLGETVYSFFSHRLHDPASQKWRYRIVVIDAAGDRRSSTPVTASSRTSIVLEGTPVMAVGDFDGKSLELALAPDGYARYPEEFPEDVDFTVGADRPDQGWCYIHPGPLDRWAGSTDHVFTLRFDADEHAGDQHTGEPLTPARLTLALWLIDAHASSPGYARIALNGHEVTEVAIEAGATRGHLLGDSTLPDSPLIPSYVELGLPADLLQPGENVLTIDKTDGSYHVYDAVGIFRPSPGS